MDKKEFHIDSMIVIIESPDPNDILDGVSEAVALSSSLDLAKLNVRHYQVYNRETLSRCFQIVANEITSSASSHFVIQPHFHFSAHGNEEGIELTSGDFINWEDLGEMLIAFAYDANAVGPEVDHEIKHQCCLFAVSFSSCNGAAARKMFSCQGIKPCFAVIGPTTAVGWADSLTAYNTFFHLLKVKKMSAGKAVERMNLAAGLEKEFKCYLHNQPQNT